jgi:uncharacterized membrane protein
MDQTEPEIYNDPAAVRLRKDENTLVVVGGGVILFGVWSLVKALLYLISDRTEIIEEIPYDEIGKAGVIVVVAAVFLILMADLAVRLYVGMSARAEGRGHKKSPVYLILTGVMVLGSLITLFILIRYGKAAANDVPDLIISTLIELTSMVLECEMIYAGIRVRRARTQEINTGKKTGR